MIERFVDIIASVGFEVTAEQVADAVWLAMHMPAERGKSGAVTPDPNERSDVLEAPFGAPSDSNVSPPTESTSSTGTTESFQTGPQPGDLLVPEAGVSESRQIKARAVRVPSAEALPNKNSLNRALRPLKRKYPSRQTRVLDVTATVEQVANGGPAVAILKPALERWLDVALIVDESASMQVWWETISELELLLERHGSFRDVRNWYLNLDDGSMKLYSEPGLSNLPRRLRHPKELIDPSSRRLIVIVTDCMAAGWRNDAMFKTIREWGRRGPLALLQVLPERLWGSTGLGESIVKLRARSAAGANSSLGVQRAWFDQEFESPGESKKKPEHSERSYMPLPIINLESWSVEPWAKLVANVGEASADGVLVPAESKARPDTYPGAPDQQAPVSASERVRSFRAAASPSALQLAGYLSVAPLCLPVMRLVQKAMLPRVRQVDLAEVLLGGLMRQNPSANVGGRGDAVFYEFYLGVRELLQDSVKSTDQVRVLQEVSRLIESQTGTTLDFGALLVGDKATIGQQGLYPLGQKFAEIASDVLKRLGWSDRPPQEQPEPLETPADIFAAPLQVFLSFSSRDERLVRKILPRLTELDREGWSNTWSAVDMQSGSAEDFRRVVESRLKASNVFLALVSSAYLDSTWTPEETRQAIRSEMLIVPVPLEDVILENSDLARYHGRVDIRPLNSWENEDEALDDLISKVREAYIDRLLFRNRQRVRQALIRITSGNVVVPGVFVSPGGLILALAQFIQGSDLRVTLSDGTVRPAEIVRFDATSELVLLKILDTSDAWLECREESESSSFLIAVSGQERGIPEELLSQVTGEAAPYLRVKIFTRRLAGTAGSLLIDRHGRIAGIVRSFNSDTNDYLCISGEHARQFVVEGVDRRVEPNYDVEVCGLRELRMNITANAWGKATLADKSAVVVTDIRSGDLLSVRSVSSSVSRRPSDSGFQLTTRIDIVGLIVADLLTVDRISLRVSGVESADGAAFSARIDGAVFENLRFHGYPVDIALNAEAFVLAPRRSEGNSIVQRLSSANPNLRINGNTIKARNFGSIELLPIIGLPPFASLCGLRINLDGPQIQTFDCGVISFQERTRDVVWPPVDGRKSLMAWLADIDSSRRQPILIVNGRRGSGKTTTIEYLRLAARESRRFVVAAVDLENSPSSPNVETVVRSIAAQVGWDVSSLPGLRALDWSARHHKRLVDWMAQQSKRFGTVIIVFDALRSPNVPKGFHAFIKRLCEEVTEANNPLVVLLDYDIEDLPMRVRPSVFLEDLSPRPSRRPHFLVVGTGAHDLPKAVQNAAEVVGSVLGRLDFVLITGGWQGVDYVAAEAFSKEMRTAKKPLNDRLFQLVEAGEDPDFKGGSIERLPDHKAFSGPVSKSDVIVLIGGAGGTWQSFRHGLQANRPVIPFMSTGSDARHAAILLEIFGQNIDSELIKLDFSNEQAAKRSARYFERVLMTLDTELFKASIDNRDLIWMVESVLVEARLYLSKEPGFEEKANRIAREFASREISPDKYSQLALALINDSDPVWRITSYLAIETKPLREYVSALASTLDREVREAFDNEARPLWRWLSAVFAVAKLHSGDFPSHLIVRLQDVARRLRSRSEIDPRGECRQLTNSILQILQPVSASPKLRRTKRKKEKTKKKK
jgi:hypothetical protein